MQYKGMCTMESHNMEQGRLLDYSSINVFHQSGECLLIPAIDNKLLPMLSTFVFFWHSGFSQHQGIATNGNAKWHWAFSCFFHNFGAHKYIVHLILPQHRRYTHPTSGNNPHSRAVCNCQFILNPLGTTDVAFYFWNNNFDHSSWPSYKQINAVICKNFD